MGSISLSIEKLNNFFLNPDNDNSWENMEIKKFIKRAFSIGKDKTIEDVFEKELSLISLQFDCYEFFKLSQNQNAIKFFNKCFEEQEEFDDVLFDLAENNFNEFNRLYEDLMKYNDYYNPPSEKPKLEMSAIEPKTFKNSYSVFDKISEKSDQTNSDLDPILKEINKKIEFAHEILFQLISNRDVSQDKLLNSNVKNLMQSYIDKKKKEDTSQNEINYWEKLLNDTSMQINQAKDFFDDDYSRTGKFFEKTLSDLETLKENILNIDLNDFEENKNFNSSFNNEIEENFSIEMSMSSSAYEFEEEIPETVEEILNRLARKMNITLNKDLFINSFAMNRFFQYYSDIRKIKSNVLPIIEEWKEE